MSEHNGTEAYHFVSGPIDRQMVLLSFNPFHVIVYREREDCPWQTTGWDPPRSRFIEAGEAALYVRVTQDEFKYQADGLVFEDLVDGRRFWRLTEEA